MEKHFETLICSWKEKVFTIKLNRPEVLNAVNFKMIEELEYVIPLVNQREDVNVIVMCGAGGRAFSTGGDQKQFQAIRTKDDAYRMLSRMANVINQIAASPKVTIAGINGYALGGGMELTTAFDIRVATHSSKLGFIQSKIGLTSGWGGGTRLLNQLGTANTLPSLLLGEIFPAPRWAELGYIHELFNPKDFEHELHKLAFRYTQVPNGVIEAYKDMSNRIEVETRLKSLIEDEVLTCAKLWEEEAHLSAVQTFLHRK